MNCENAFIIKLKILLASFHSKVIVKLKFLEKIGLPKYGM